MFCHFRTSDVTLAPGEVFTIILMSAHCACLTVCMTDFSTTPFAHFFIVSTTIIWLTGCIILENNSKITAQCTAV